MGSSNHSSRMVVVVVVVTNNKATGKVVTANSKATGKVAMGSNKVDTKPKEVLTDNNKHLNILPMVELLLLSQPLPPIGKVLRLQMDRFTITINEQERLNGTNQWECRKVFRLPPACCCYFVFLCWLLHSSFMLALLALLACTCSDAVLFEFAVILID